MPEIMTELVSNLVNVVKMEKIQELCIRGAVESQDFKIKDVHLIATQHY